MEKEAIGISKPLTNLMYTSKSGMTVYFNLEEVGFLTANYI